MKDNTSENSKVLTAGIGIGFQPYTSGILPVHIRHYVWTSVVPQGTALTNSRVLWEQETLGL